MAQTVGITRRTLSRIMREARRNAGIKAGAAASEVGISAPTLSKYERSENPWPPPVVYALCDHYGLTTEDRDRLVGLAKQREPGWWQTSAVPEWFAPYLGAEAEAAQVDNYNDALIPGLAQTADYARRLITVSAEPGADEAEIEGHVASRIRRQERLRAEQPVQFSAVFNESALYRRVGSAQVMAEQLEHLIRLSRLPNVDLRVLPFEAGEHVATEGSFVLLAFPDVIKGLSSGEAVYIEYAIGALFLEREEETSEYRTLYKGVQGAALSPERSRELVQRVLDERYE